MLRKTKINLQLINATSGYLAAADGGEAIKVNLMDNKSIFFNLALYYQERGDSQTAVLYNGINQYKGLARKEPQADPPNFGVVMVAIGNNDFALGTGTNAIVSTEVVGSTDSESFRIAVDSNTDNPVRNYDWYGELEIIEIDN